MKVVRLSAIYSNRHYPQKIFLVLISVRGCVILGNQGHSAAGRIMSMKNSGYTIGNRLVAQCLNQMHDRVSGLLEELGAFTFNRKG